LCGVRDAASKTLHTTVLPGRSSQPARGSRADFHIAQDFFSKRLKINSKYFSNPRTAWADHSQSGQNRAGVPVNLASRRNETGLEGGWFSDSGLDGGRGSGGLGELGRLAGATGGGLSEWAKGSEARKGAG
jgi:hypothetical protein